MPEEYVIEAMVHTAVGKGGYRVKVSVPELGLFLNGAVVFPNTKDEGGKWVMFPPSYRIGKNPKPFYPAEFDRSKPLWQELSEAAFLAVEKFIDAGEPAHNHPADDIFNDPLLNSKDFDEDMKRQLDEVSKAFGLE